MFSAFLSHCRNFPEFTSLFAAVCRLWRWGGCVTSPGREITAGGSWITDGAATERKCGKIMMTQQEKSAKFHPTVEDLDNSTGRIVRNICWATVLVAALGGPFSQADVRVFPKVRIDHASFTPARSGQPFETQIEILIPEDGQLSRITAAGDGWQVERIDSRNRIDAKRGESITMLLRATPDDAEKPLMLSFDWNGQTIAKELLIGEDYVAKRERGFPLQWLPGTRPVELIGRARIGLIDQGPDAASGGECSNMSLAISGRFVYERTGEDCTGAGQCTPVDSIAFRIVDDDLVGGETMFEGETDRNGDFSANFVWDDCDIFGCDCPDIYIEFEADTDIVKVQSTDILEIEYSWSTSDESMDDFTGSAINFGTLLPASDGMDTNPATHIHNSITKAHQFILSRDGTDVEQVDVQWPEDSGAWYNTFFEEIHIGVDREWREDTHTHEYGHHYLENHSQNPGPDYCNGFCDTNGCGHCMWCPENDHDAWNEGWPNWLADVVTRAYASGELADYASINTRPQEALRPCSQDNQFANPLITEGFAGALCRDIEDTGEDADNDGVQDTQPLCASDSLALGVDEIFQVVRLDQPVNILEFISAFRVRFPENAPGLWRTANSIGGNAFVWPDNDPPGIVQQLNSPTHPMGTGGTLPVVTVDWTHAPDDASGAEDYSIVWATSPLEPDFTADILGVTTSDSPPIPVGSTLFISLRARDCLGNWSTEWSSFGPFEITECNGNGIVDVCEVNCAAFGGFCNVADCGMASDCNANVNPDSCDIDGGNSSDCNVNLVPDECEGLNFALWNACTTGPPPLGVQMCGWHVATNWRDGMPPGPNDNVCIEEGPLSLLVEHTFQSGTTDILSLGCYEPFFMSGGTMNIADNAAFFDDYTMTGGVMSGSGDITVEGQMGWSSGTIQTLDPMTPSDLQMNGGLDIEGFVTLAGARNAVNNGSGQMTTNQAWLRLREGAMFTNTGTFTTLQDGTIDRSGGTGRFVNNGVFNKNGNDVERIGVLFENNDTLNINSGTLHFSIDGVVNNAGIVGAAGTTMQSSGSNSSLDFGSNTDIANLLVTGGTTDVFGTFEATESTRINTGTLTFQPTATLVDVGDALTLAGGIMDVSCGEGVSVTEYTQQSGTFTGSSGQVDVAGPVVWNGGTMTTSDNAKLTTNAQGSTTIQGFVILAGDRTFNNIGTATFETTPAWLRINNNAAFRNMGTFNAQSDGPIDRSGGNGSFDNLGSYNKLGPNVQNISVQFDNSGQIDVTNGTLAFGGLGLTSTGSVNGLNDARLQFSGGAHTFLPSSLIDVPNLTVVTGTVDVNGSYTVSGTTRIGGGSLNINPVANLASLGSNLEIGSGTLNINTGPGQTVQTLLQTGGILAGATSSLDVVGTSMLSGGTMGSSGGNPVTTTARGDATIDGFFTLSGDRTFVSQSTTTMTGAQAWLRVNNDAVFINDGTFDANADGRMDSGTGGDSAFVNNGAYNKNGPNVQPISIAYVNNGQVNVNDGILSFSGGGLTNRGDIGSSPNGTLQLSTGNHVLESASTVNIANLSVTGGSTDVNGLFECGQDLTLTNGTLNFNPPANLVNIGDSLTIGAGVLNLSSGESAEVSSFTLTGGTFTGSSSGLTINGPSLISGGTMSTEGGVPWTTRANGDVQIDGFFQLGGDRVFQSEQTVTFVGNAAHLRLQNRVEFHNNGTFDAESDGSITTNGGTPQFVNNGTYNKLGAANQAVSARFINNGILRLQNGSMQFNGAGYRQNAGATILDGGTLGSNSNINIQGGIVTGDGMITADVTNGGAFEPGASPGVIDIVGDYTQTVNGVLRVEIGGLTAGTEHDVLNVSDNAFLNGTLDIRVINGFAPSVGDSFVIMNHAVGFGTFLNVTGAALGGTRFDVIYNVGNVTLNVVADSTGDCDNDGDFDLADFANLANCETGPAGGPLLGNCACSDFDGDGDIDLVDWSVFQRSFTGDLP